MVFIPFLLCDVIISRWNCRPQSFLLSGVDGNTWLSISRQKVGDLCSSRGLSHVTWAGPSLPPASVSASVKGGGGAAHLSEPGVPGARGQGDRAILVSPPHHGARDGSVVLNFRCPVAAAECCA